MSFTFNCWPDGSGFGYYVDAPAGTEFNVRLIASGSGGHQLSKELSGIITDGNRQYYEPIFFMVMNVGVAELSFDLPNDDSSGTGSNGKDSHSHVMRTSEALKRRTDTSSLQKALVSASAFDEYPYPYPYPLG